MGQSGSQTLAIVLFIALLSVIPLLSVAEVSYIIKPRAETPCPVLPQSRPCLTLAEYVGQEDSYPNTTLQFLPGEHNLAQNITTINAASFKMIGDFLSSPSQGDPATTITCIGPATLSFHDSQEVSLQAIEFIHCGDLYQPAIMVSSIQYFEMIDCSVKDSSGVGMLANGSALSLHNISFQNSSHTGMLLINGMATFTGNTAFTRNGNSSWSMNSRFILSSPEHWHGGLAAINCSMQFLGNARFQRNVGIMGGGVYAERCTLNFQGCLIVDENTAISGGGMYALQSSLTLHNLSLSFDSTCTRSKKSILHYCIIKANTACNGSGGGLLLHNSSLRSNYTLYVKENEALGSGGGFGAFHSYFSISGIVLFVGNTAKEGARICVGGTSLSRDSTVETNRSEDARGGICISQGNVVSFGGNIKLIRNRRNNGGAIYLLHSSGRFSGLSVFINNTAVRYGGGLGIDRSTLVFFGNTLLRANTGRNGGGMMTRSSYVMFNRGTSITENSALGGGGGIVGMNSSIHFHDLANLKDNRADTGGGMGIINSKCTVKGNASILMNLAYTKGGGIVAFENSTVTFEAYIEVIRNRAVHAGGLYAYRSTVVCMGTTKFINNIAKDAAGGLAGFFSFLRFFGSSIFNMNTASMGGAIILHKSFLEFGGTAAFKNNGTQSDHKGMRMLNNETTSDGFVLFYRNAATVIGGAVFILDLQFLDDSEQTNCIFRKGAFFTKNRAIIGGGIAALGANLDFLGMVHFQNNSAGGSGVKIGSGGAVYSNYCVLRFLMECTFSGNTAFDGGGLHGSRTTIIANERLNIMSNHAVMNGGGLYLAGDSACLINETAVLSLSRNTAGRFGGAVYIRDDLFLYCANGGLNLGFLVNCFLQPTRWPSTAIIDISDNSAGEAGSALYGGRLEDCRLEVWGDLLFPNSTQREERFQWIFSNYSFPMYSKSSSISSDPIHICLCISNIPRCNVSKYNVMAFPGGIVYISLVSIGQMNGTVPSVIIARHLDPGIALPNYQDAQSANKTCTTLEYRVLATAVSYTPKNYTMLLQPESQCNNYIMSLPVIIQLLPCPSGFHLSLYALKSCICSHRIQQYTNTCDIDTQTILRHGQYWIGWDTTSNGAILHPHCPFDYCRSGNTTFTVNDTDRQCQRNRAGLLCGRCKQGYSLALGSSECLNCSTNSYLSLILAFALAGVILVVFLLTCKLTVAMGTINGLIFYANIVAANQALYFPQHNSEGAFLRIFIAWINLDLGIETCFYHGMDMYTRTWLQLVFPLYIWTLVGIVIVLCHYFSAATQIFGNNPVAVLATLVLLSYTKLLRTIITAMSFTYLDYPDNPRVAVWLYDGNVRYLQSKHIVLFVVSLFALIFLFLPYTLVLFARQWIETKSHLKFLRWISSYRVKPFLDAHHGPLKGAHRYWPGLLLICRAILFIAFTFNAFGDPNINLLAIITCIIGLLTLPMFSGPVYKSIYVYILEVLFMLNTIILAVATAVLELAERNQLIVTYTSVGIAFGAFIGTVLCHIVVQVKESRTWKDTIKPKLQLLCYQCQPRGVLSEPLLLDQLDQNLVINPTAVTATTSTSVNLRELLLEDEPNR